jgi:hypothetical protein
LRGRLVDQAPDLRDSAGHGTPRGIRSGRPDGASSSPIDERPGGRTRRVRCCRRRRGSAGERNVTAAAGWDQGGAGVSVPPHAGTGSSRKRGAWDGPNGMLRRHRTLPGGLRMRIRLSAIVWPARWPHQRPRSNRPHGNPRTCSSFPQDITAEALTQRMREFSFALNVRCQYCHAGGDGVSFDGRRLLVGREDGEG